MPITAPPRRRRLNLANILRPGVSRSLVLLLALSLTATAASARALYYQARPGVWRLFDENAAPLAPSPANVVKSGNITFIPTYVDQVNATGSGFDDPVDGANRRAVVSAVFAYLNTTLNYSGVSLDIQFLVSQPIGPGVLAVGSTLFADAPGFSNGIAYEHLTTGVDPAPGATPDVLCQVDFTFPWNTLYPANPGSSDYDLFSVLLHELTHGLGFANLASATGAPESPFVFVYAGFNSFMRRGNGFALFTLGAVFQGSSADLISNDVFFDGPQATAAFGARPPLEAPNPFVSGRSLSHWKLYIAGGAVMEPAIAPGVTRRAYAPVDLGALRDLGYNVMGTPFPTPPPPNAAEDWAIFE